MTFGEIVDVTLAETDDVIWRMQSKDFISTLLLPSEFICSTWGRRRRRDFTRSARSIAMALMPLSSALASDGSWTLLSQRTTDVSRMSHSVSSQCLQLTRSVCQQSS